MIVLHVDSDGVSACAHAAAEALRAGLVVILPTDTIYGLSVRADDLRAVRRLNRLKGRARPSTLIPPNAAWLSGMVAANKRRSLATLLARYRGDTLLLPCSKSAPTSSGFIGVREPRHWIRRLAAEFPIITTSVNRTRLPPMTCLEDLDPAIAKGVAVLIYEGPCARRASDLIYCDGPRARRVRR